LIGEAVGIGNHLRYACHPQLVTNRKMAVFLPKSPENDGFLVVLSKVLRK
jgi:hypothetical protein